MDLLLDKHLCLSCYLDFSRATLVSLDLGGTAQGGAWVPGVSAGVECVSRMLGDVKSEKEALHVWRQVSLHCSQPHPKHPHFSPPGVHTGFLTDLPTSSLAALKSLLGRTQSDFFINVFLKYAIYTGMDVSLKYTAWWSFTNWRQSHKQHPGKEIRCCQQSRCSCLFLSSHYSP